MNVDNFISTLPFMAKGMLGIFIVTLIIIGVMYLLKFVSDKEKK